MSRPKSIKYISPDMTCRICLYCDSGQGAAWADNNNYSINHGICTNCIDKFKMDSIKDTDLEIKLI